MSDLFFWLKTIISTVVLIVILQVKIGETTLEQKFHGWLTTSEQTKPLREVAHGGVRALQISWRKLTGHINGQFFEQASRENQPGHRDLKMRLKRSKEYLSKKAQEAKQALEDKVEQQLLDEAKAKSENVQADQL